MVEDIVPMPESNCVHVKLNYQASVKNAKAKLGALSALVSVHKFSAFVKDDELSLLDELKKQYGFGIGADAESPKSSHKKQKVSKKVTYLENTANPEDDSESDNE